MTLATMVHNQPETGFVYQLAFCNKKNAIQNPEAIMVPGFLLSFVLIQLCTCRNVVIKDNEVKSFFSAFGAGLSLASIGFIVGNKPQMSHSVT